MSLATGEPGQYAVCASRSKSLEGIDVGRNRAPPIGAREFGGLSGLLRAQALVGNDKPGGFHFLIAKQPRVRDDAITRWRTGDGRERNAISPMDADNSNGLAEEAAIGQGCL